MKKKTAPLPFKQYLAEELGRTKGKYYPVPVSVLKRIRNMFVPIEKLHPNPEDEFCDPAIGPNYEIISGYEADYRRAMEMGDEGFIHSGIREAIMVQKAKPDGYLIMNGHHRWAAAYRAGLPKVKIRVINVTQPKDIERMLMQSKSERRVTLDLDEVVFGKEGETALEKPFRFPLNRIYTSRVRQGIPALLSSLNNQGYDVWLYTSSLLYSEEYIRYYFRHWNVRLAGIVNGAGHKGIPERDPDGELKKLAETRYRSTTHIDSGLVLRTFSGSREIEEYPLSGSDDTWSREVMEVFEKIRHKDLVKPGP